ncbi:MAG: TIGR03757 family integrating conjugative element protein [Candidatus Accumulibacter sp.]|jgi:integrating conjugative element protein (TIGR03757 family)|nr:TIGR03757 family integrating conjugative element protein [Accumulibacter sp.]
MLQARLSILSIGLCFLLFGLTAAADVLIVTDRQHPVRAASDVRLIELDRPMRIEAELSAGLPADPGRASEIVRQRLREGDIQDRLRKAYQGVVEARGLGIGKIPAVVVDQRYVVYGETDVAQAVTRIEAHRRTQP